MGEPTKLLDALRDPTWVIRRKEAMDLLSERLMRHRVSIDFRCQQDDAVLPLFFLRKAAGQFTKFDFHDETGRSLPLPTREENVTASSEILEAAARDVLDRHDLGMTPILSAELDFIAREEPDLALAALKHRWPGQAPHAKLWGRLRRRIGRSSKPTPAFAENKTVLMEDPFFRWLIRTLAYSSIVCVRVAGTPGSRRVLKLVYDEEVNDLVRPGSAGIRAGVARRLGYLLYRVGWRGYPVDVVIPYVGAQTFHFELHAPDGTEILEALIREVPASRVRGRRTRVHLYLNDIRAVRSATAFVQLRVRGIGFIGAAVWASLAITAAIGACWIGADDLAHKSLGSAPSLLLLFPGLAATYLARAEHPLAARLLRFARLALFLAALTAYAAAARLAVADASTTRAQLVTFFKPLTVVAATASLVLLLTSALPLPLSHWARRPFRLLWRAGRPAAAPDL